MYHFLLLLLLMFILICMHSFAILNVHSLSYNDVRGTAYSVTYDDRAILINHQRVLLRSASIHYPRSPMSLWHDLLQQAESSGINLIETYIFWNLHQLNETHMYIWDNNEYRNNLISFVESVASHNLFLMLRFGPYVCAEWNYGGHPSYLQRMDGIEIRTDNEIYKTEVEDFIRHLGAAMEPYVARNGGNIIMFQIENEYGIFEVSSFDSSFVQ